MHPQDYRMMQPPTPAEYAGRKRAFGVQDSEVPAISLLDRKFATIHRGTRRRRAVLVGLVLLALCVTERAAVSQLTPSAPATSESEGPPQPSAQTRPQEGTTPHQAAKADQPVVVRGVTVLPAKTGVEAPIERSDRARTGRFLIGADDVLAINVWKEPEVSRTVPVRSDGKISLPLVGELAASGRTPQELQNEISKKLQAYMSEPEVTVIVEQIKSQYFNILGQVARPGSYPLTKPMTVVDAIAVAGGFRDFAKQKQIYVLRHNPDGSETRIPCNYKTVIKGKSPDHLELASHDTIVVP